MVDINEVIYKCIKLTLPQNAICSRYQVGQEDEVIRIIWEDEGIRFKTNIEVSHGEKKAVVLAGEEFMVNATAFFPDESQPSTQIEDTHYETWMCAYRFVDGATSPFRMSHAYVDLPGLVLHLSFLAEPDRFDIGYPTFLEITKSVLPSA